ncbi:MAG: hypothetical protein GTO16_04530 [Candidatus Aminicenantes bacterium]|nr:hypothetical protein [Candidatus Aminicenantes bacterium]
MILVLTSVIFSSPIFLSNQEKNKQEPSAQHFIVTPATSPIKVDGILDEQAWTEAVVIKLPYEWLPGDNIPSPVDTDCLVTFDKKYFYVAFRCYDPEAKKIRAHLMDRDSTDTFIQDDHVVIMVDTFNDERRAFQFRVNPLGVQADANFSESEGYEDFSWDAIWNSRGRISDWGYAVEIAIPFSQLRFTESSEGQTWGFGAERSYPRSVRHRMSSHMRRRDIGCILCQQNKITGLQGMTTGLNIEIDPTLTAIRTDIREDFPAGAVVAGDEELDPGVTFRWGITPNLILNATANPDFSQVEADVAQLDVNTRFALYYPEKRPFFLEGADFFLTPVQAVFTRTVADPDGGLKLTGKLGKSAIGFFAAYDRINNLIFPANQGSVSTSIDQDVTSGVLRYRRDVGRNSTVGLLYTGRTADDYYNHVGGVDGFLRLSRTKELRFQYLHSETDYTDATSSDFGQPSGHFGGDAFRASFNHFGRNWTYGLSYNDRNPTFRADYGFVPRVDIRSANAQITRRIWGKRGEWFTQITFSAGGNVTYDHEGNLTDSTVALETSYFGPLQTAIQVTYFRERERFLQEIYDKDQLSFYTEIKPAGGIRFNIMGWLGDVIDYSNARKASALNVIPSAEIILGRNININFRHDFQRFTLRGDEIFEANLSQLKVVYNFNLRMFVRGIIQYLNLARTPALYVDPVPRKMQTVFTQILFSYKLNPQTVFFLGYSDNYFGETGIDIAQTDRTFFIKLGYAWTK